MEVKIGNLCLSTTTKKKKREEIYHEHSNLLAKQAKLIKTSIVRQAFVIVMLFESFITRDAFVGSRNTLIKEV